MDVPSWLTIVDLLILLMSQEKRQAYSSFMSDLQQASHCCGSMGSLYTVPDRCPAPRVVCIVLMQRASSRLRAETDRVPAAALRETGEDTKLPDSLLVSSRGSKVMFPRCKIVATSFIMLSSSALLKPNDVRAEETTSNSALSLTPGMVRLWLWLRIL